ncbi:MAG: methyl-accepting chemotaxis protein [Synergistaceae bacterium]|nr:methyl-accepting chemotaxis protein [Synergistaceae bacterium]
MKKLKMQGKILCLILPLVLVILVTIESLTFWRLSDYAARSVETDLRNNAVIATGLLTTAADAMFAAAQSLGAALGEMDGNAPGSREQAYRAIRGVYVNTPGVLSVWAVFEPNAFDGRDAEYRTSEHPSGRFVAIYSGNRSNPELTWSTDAELAAADWYSRTLRAGHPVLFDPFLFNYSGRPGDDILMTTAALPIRRNGNIIGVAGVDIPLGMTESFYEKLQLPKGGSLTYFSNDGTIVGGMGKGTEGRNLAELRPAEARRALPLIASGRGDSWVEKEAGVDVVVNYYPIVGEIGAAWSLRIAVPQTELYRGAGDLRNYIFILYAIAIIIISVVLTLLVRRIVEPIRTTSKLINRFGELDLRDPRTSLGLDTSAIERRNDEISDMLKACANLRNNVTYMLSSMSAEAERFSETALNLTAISEEAVAAMEEVKESVEESSRLSQLNSEMIEKTDTAISEVSKSASATADAVIDAAQAASQTTNLNQQSAQNVKNITSNILSAGERSKAGNNSIDKVNASVAHMTGFITTITGIADQTNLLALNAAIEAARAGESGRGFAVVAEEVRKLAEESARAAQEVNNLITELRSDTKVASDVIIEMKTMLEEMTAQTEVVRKSMEDEYKEVEFLNERMQNIAASAEEQAASSGEIAGAISQAAQATANVARNLDDIRQATAETATASERVAQEAQGVNEGVERLSNLLSMFKFDRETEKSLAPRR